MPKVTLKSAVKHNNGVAKAGETIELSDERYKELEKAGKLGALLHEGGRTEQQQLRNQIERSERRTRLPGGAYEDYDEDVEPEVRVVEKLIFLPGVTPAQYQALSDAGYGTPDAMRAASDEELRDVEGVGPKAVENLRVALGAG